MADISTNETRKLQPRMDVSKASSNLKCLTLFLAAFGRRKISTAFFVSFISPSMLQSPPPPPGVTKSHTRDLLGGSELV